MMRLSFFYHISNLLLFLLPIVFAEEVCDVNDGTCMHAKNVNECKDLDESCQKWAEIGECETNPRYMLTTCARSCDSCASVLTDDSQEDEGEEEEKPRDDFGVVQRVGGKQTAEVAKAIEDMKVYFQRLRDDPSTAERTLGLLDDCKNEHELCAYWKVIGECEKVREWGKRIQKMIVTFSSNYFILFFWKESRLYETSMCRGMPNV